MAKKKDTDQKTNSGQKVDLLGKAAAPKGTPPPPPVNPLVPKNPLAPKAKNPLAPPKPPPSAAKVPPPPPPPPPPAPKAPPKAAPPKPMPKPPAPAPKKDAKAATSGAAKKGDGAVRTIKMENGDVYEIIGELGSGGQGKVYRAKNRADGVEYAVKVYLKEQSPEFIKNLKENILNGPPHPAFLWPKVLTEPLGKAKNRYGYVMDIFGKEYESFAKILKNQAKFPSKEIQLAALVNLCEAFEALHAAGYSYQDLNDGGVRFNVNTGKILIADNDNVSPYGVNLGILGMFKYMAPEVAINMFMPDKHSDRFSLAVMMFMILCKAHPYDGAMRLAEQPMTPHLQKKIYGMEPVFIYHPTDESNRPDRQMDKNALKAWPLLPDFIQELFTKTFTSGMPKLERERRDIESERQQRVSEREWIEALNKWMDTMTTCPHCKKSACLKIDESNKLVKNNCAQCGGVLDLQMPVVLIKRRGLVVHKIVLENNKQVSKYSVVGEQTSEPAFIVIESPKRPGIYGLVNKMSGVWTCSQPSVPGVQPRLISPGEVVPALPGVHLEFDGEYVGEVVV